MSTHKTKKPSSSAVLATVKKEMLRPRSARSARIAGLKLDASRNPEPPSTTMPGSVDKIIPSTASNPEKAQIAVDRKNDGHRKLRIENDLTDEHGDEVKLKKGAHVEVTVTEADKSTDSTKGKSRAPRR